MRGRANPFFPKFNGIFWNRVGGYGYNRAGAAGEFSADVGYKTGLGGEMDWQTTDFPLIARPIRESEVLHPSDMVAIGDSHVESLSTKALLDGRQEEVLKRWIIWLPAWLPRRSCGISLS